MSCLVCTGATLQCSFGATPSALMVIPKALVLVPATPAATIADNLPMANVSPFGVCTSMANPMVIAATAAAQGVLTPQPCIPVPVAPWTPGALKVLIGGVPALEQTSKLVCAWGGAISVLSPGQFTALTP